MMNLIDLPEFKDKTFLNFSDVWYKHTILPQSPSNVSLILREYLDRLQNLSHQSKEYSVTIEKLFANIVNSNFKTEEISFRDFILLSKKALFLINNLVSTIGQNKDKFWCWHNDLIEAAVKGLNAQKIQREKELENQKANEVADERNNFNQNWVFDLTHTESYVNRLPSIDEETKKILVCKFASLEIVLKLLSKLLTSEFLRENLLCGMINEKNENR
jgi:hypothetical protein